MTAITKPLITICPEPDWLALIKRHNFQVPVVVWETGEENEAEVRVLAAYAANQEARFGVWGYSGVGQDTIVFRENCRLATVDEIQLACEEHEYLRRAG